MSDISQQKLMTVSEAAAAIRKNARFVRRGIRDGKIPAVHFGRDAMIHEFVVLQMQRFGMTGSRHFSERPTEEKG
jgi:excisionase family DNA binding protein